MVLASLVDLAQAGNKEAFGTLAQLVGDRSMAIANRILRDADLAAAIWTVSGVLDFTTGVVGCRVSGWLSY